MLTKSFRTDQNPSAMPMGRDLPMRLLGKQDVALSSLLFGLFFCLFYPVFVSLFRAFAYSAKFLSPYSQFRITSSWYRMTATY